MLAELKTARDLVHRRFGQFDAALVQSERTTRAMPYRTIRFLVGPVTKALDGLSEALRAEADLIEAAKRKAADLRQVAQWLEQPTGPAPQAFVPDAIVGLGLEAKASLRLTLANNMRATAEILDREASSALAVHRRARSAAMVLQAKTEAAAAQIRTEKHAAALGEALDEKRAQLMADIDAREAMLRDAQGKAWTEWQAIGRRQAEAAAESQLITIETRLLIDEKTRREREDTPVIARAESLKAVHRKSLDSELSK
jgi:hypothetical protein